MLRNGSLPEHVVEEGFLRGETLSPYLVMNPSARTLLSFLCTALLCAGWSPSLHAKRPPPVRFAVEFPQQGAAIGESSSIRLSGFGSEVPWTRGAIRITAVEARKDVNPSSEAAAVSVPRETPIASPGTEFTIPVKVSAPGEYGLRIEVRVSARDGKEYSNTFVVAVLAEDGAVWLGSDSIEAAGVNRIRAARDGSGAPGSRKRVSAVAENANEEISRWVKEREARQLENKSRTGQ